MSENDWEYLPLILERNEYISTYIIDNQLIGSDNREISFGIRPFKAYKLLCDLVRNNATKKAIP